MVSGLLVFGGPTASRTVSFRFRFFDRNQSVVIESTWLFPVRTVAALRGVDSGGYGYE